MHHLHDLCTIFISNQTKPQNTYKQNKQNLEIVAYPVYLETGIQQIFLLVMVQFIKCLCENISCRFNLLGIKW